MDRCEATTLGTRCERIAGHEDEHENMLYAWIELPPVPGRGDQANPFGR